MRRGWGATAARGLIVAGVVGLAAVAAGGAPAHGDTNGSSGPAVVVSPASVGIGDDVIVELDNWPSGPVNVAVCGNNARRGSEDCDLINSAAVAVRGAAPAYLRFTITAPPVGCPCVVRASTSASETVRAAPVTISGLPLGTDIAPSDPVGTPRQLHVSVRLVRDEESLGERVLPPFAGPVEYTLAVTLHNTGATPLRNLRIVGSVGKSKTNAEPIDHPAPVSLAAGEVKRIPVGVHVSAPAWGGYRVFGAVYGAAAPTTFAVAASNDPWALELMVPLLLLVLAYFVHRHEQRVKERERLAAIEAAHREEFRPSSPDVGALDGGRWGSPTYDPEGSEPTLPDHDVVRSTA
jgi:hypothetical protein